MKCILRKLIATSVMISVLALMSSRTEADLTVTVDSSISTAFMNVFEIDRTDPVPVAGSFVFASTWGFADLSANFEGDGSLTLSDPTPSATLLRSGTWGAVVLVLWATNGWTPTASPNSTMARCRG